jgi:hypothetical protein
MDLNKHHHAMPNPAIHASPYSNPDEKNQHERIIGTLATEVSRSFEEVEPLYEDILAHMKDKARVQDFLSIFVSRRVKALLS